MQNDVRLIDANALLKDFAERQELDRSDGDFADCFANDAQELSTEWWCVEDAVEAAPTIDAAPVVHARWIDRDGKTWCDNCAASNKAYKPPYCPHCGAKMDAKEE